jgi:hypothetical protein
MPTMTLKEWAAEYRAYNQSQLAEKKVVLPLRSIADSVKTYFVLCRLVADLNSDDDPNLWKMRQHDYLNWEKTLVQIARRQKVDLPR